MRKIRATLFVLISCCLCQCRPEDPEYLEWRVFSVENFNLPSNRISLIAKDASQNLWAVAGQQLLVIEGEQWLPVLTLQPNEIITSGKGAGNYMWFGTSFGLLRVDIATFSTENYTVSNSGLSSDQVTAVAVETTISNDVVWASTIFGLNRFDGITWTSYLSSNTELSANEVTAIGVDGLGKKWLSTYDQPLSSQKSIQCFNDATNSWITFTSDNTSATIEYVKDIRFMLFRTEEHNSPFRLANTDVNGSTTTSNRSHISSEAVDNQDVLRLANNSKISTNYISIYPNPTQNGIFNIVFNNAEGVKWSYELYNAMGQLLMQDYTSQYTRTVSIDHLAKGSYIVKVITSSSCETFKLSHQ